MSMNVVPRKVINKWFTLIEILIVIAIISFLLTVVMKFSGTQIWELRQKKEVEEFKDAFNMVITKNINSNYINKNKYTQLEINITKEKKDIILKYTNGNTITDTWLVLIPFTSTIFDNINTENNEQESINIKMTPYILWCTINEEKNDAYFEVLSPKKLCFTIDTITCQLKEKKCGD